MEAFKVAIAIIIIILLIFLPIYFTCIPSGVAAWNNLFRKVKMTDDKTNYDTLKKVEDTCRAMIASYKADKLMYEQYKDSDNEEKQTWAEEAKMRANRTASTYNEYILKNKYVWRDSVPEDIWLAIPYVGE